MAFHSTPLNSAVPSKAAFKPRDFEPRGIAAAGSPRLTAELRDRRQGAALKRTCSSPIKQLGSQIHRTKQSDRSKKWTLVCSASSPGGEGTGKRGSDGSEDVEEDLLGSLGDWREFRARLVRSGDVPLTDSEPDTGRSEDKADPQTLADAPADSPSSVAFQGTDESVGGAMSSPESRDTSSEASAQTVPQAGPTIVTPGNLVMPARVGNSSSFWAHSLAIPEQGCLVIAHPDAFGMSQQYFNQAVIFLFTHGEEGSAGVILNRPSQYTVGQVAGLEDYVPEFAASPLYMGGDVGPNSIICLHGIEDLKKEGALPICSGIFMGGTSGCKEHIRSGRSQSMDYRWFARYAGWAPGQLEREVKSGYWFLAASSPNVVLKQCLALKHPLWREVMELMGGEYESLSKKTYGEV